MTSQKKNLNTTCGPLHYTFREHLARFTHETGCALPPASSILSKSSSHFMSALNWTLAPASVASRDKSNGKATRLFYRNNNLLHPAAVKTRPIFQRLSFPSMRFIIERLCNSHQPSVQEEFWMHHNSMKRQNWKKKKQLFNEWTNWMNGKTNYNFHWKYAGWTIRIRMRLKIGGTWDDWKHKPIH